jgi:hypothetical protein
LGGLTPASVNSPVSDPLVREIRGRTSKETAKPLDKTKYQEGDFVYIDFPTTPFDKG